ncbi:hypothetical protein FACS1894113_5650 [Alphaproteobacteria bacterium]|nr:hypothetical protein FACS1894113_5650 [Alphaproteobacteria bacterium]
MLSRGGALRKTGAFDCPFGARLFKFYNSCGLNFYDLKSDMYTATSENHKPDCELGINLLQTAAEKGSFEAKSMLAVVMVTHGILSSQRYYPSAFALVSKPFKMGYFPASMLLMRHDKSRTDFLQKDLETVAAEALRGHSFCRDIIIWRPDLFPQYSAGGAEHKFFVNINEAFSYCTLVGPRALRDMTDLYFYPFFVLADYDGYSVFFNKVDPDKAHDKFQKRDAKRLKEYFAAK